MYLQRNNFLNLSINISRNFFFIKLKANVIEFSLVRILPKVFFTFVAAIVRKVIYNYFSFKAVYKTILSQSTLKDFD